MGLSISIRYLTLERLIMRDKEDTWRGLAGVRLRREVRSGQTQRGRKRVKGGQIRFLQEGESVRSRLRRLIHFSLII